RCRGVRCGGGRRRGGTRLRLPRSAQGLSHALANCTSGRSTNSLGWWHSPVTKWEAHDRAATRRGNARVEHPYRSVLQGWWRPLAPTPRAVASVDVLRRGVLLL